MGSKATTTGVHTKTKVIVGLVILGLIIIAAGYGWKLSGGVRYTHTNPGGGEGTVGVDYTGTVGGNSNTAKVEDDAAGNTNTSNTNTNSNSNTNATGE